MGAYFTIWSMSHMGGNPFEAGKSVITDEAREALNNDVYKTKEKKQKEEYEKNVAKHTYEGDLTITTPIMINICGSDERNWDPSLVEDFVMSHTKNYTPEVIDALQDDYDYLYIFVQFKLNNASFVHLDKHSADIMLTEATISNINNKISDIKSGIYKSLREIGKVSDEIAYMLDYNTIKQAISGSYNDKAVFAISDYGGPSEQYPMLAQYTHKGKFGNETEYIFVVTNVQNYR